jgi:hypothetical protein
VWGIPGVTVITTGDQGMIFLNDGTRWVNFTSSQFSAVNFNALWGSSVTNIYTVGSLGTILLFNGVSWDYIVSPTTLTLYSIWGSAPNNVFAGGEIGTLLNFDGNTWKTVSISTLTAQDIRALWGSSGSDIYATGSLGDILHYDGIAWGKKFSASGNTLYTLWGSASDDVFAAGKNGAVYHYDGVTWNKLSGVPFSNDIYAAWGSTSGTVYFASEDGTILIYSRDDHIPPVINYASIPKDNDGNAYIAGPFTFQFSEKMKDTTFTTTTVTLKTGSTTVPVHVSLSNDGMILTLTGSLAFSTPYTITITGGSNGVKDQALPTGNAMRSDYSVSFTTEPKPNSNSSGGGSCFIATALM